VETMNREIKFRAWDKRLKEMQFTIEMHQYKDGSMGIQIGDSLAVRDDDDFILMQYTGLKDKNGKEIYEGDVIRYTKNKHLIYPNFTTVIEYYKYSFGFRLQNSFNTYDPFCLHDEIEIDFLPYIEVIGNIYENPELLKAHK
jgi:uncharacterized phage protein (TIGR01671 family)